MAIQYDITVTCKISSNLKRQIDNFAKNYNKEQNETLSAPIRHLIEVGLQYYFDSNDEDLKEQFYLEKEGDKNPYQLQHESDLGLNERILKNLYASNGEEPISWTLLRSKGYKDLKFTDSIEGKTLTKGTFGNTKEIKITTRWIYNFGYKFTDDKQLTIVKRD